MRLRFDDQVNEVHSLRLEATNRYMNDVDPTPKRPSFIDETWWGTICYVQRCWRNHAMKDSTRCPDQEYARLLGESIAEATGLPEDRCIKVVSRESGYGPEIRDTEPEDRLIAAIFRLASWA